MNDRLILVSSINFAIRKCLFVPVTLTKEKCN